MADYSRYEINEVICAEFGLIHSDLKLDGRDRLDSLNDDGFDVIDRMRLCGNLEKAFGVSIPWEEDDQFETVKDIWNFMENA